MRVLDGMKYVKRSRSLLAGALLALATACAAACAAPAPPTLATPPALPTTPDAPTATPAAPSPTMTPPAQPAPQYTDDRSTPWSLLRSYANALSTQQYLRAYSYWEPGAALPAYPAFEASERAYTNTQVTVGAVTVDVGAGQTRWAAPVTLARRTQAGATTLSAGCVVLHLGMPAAQTPPFRGVSIEASRLSAVPTGGDANTQALQACASGNTAGWPSTTAPPTPTAIDRGQYVDDRSTPATLLQSLFNAVNRREFARAYGYWDARSATGLPPFDQYQQGYAQTDVVTLTTGAVASDVGAGQLNYRIAAGLSVTTAGGGAQRFVGCYTLHLSQPSVQATPPFQPLAIRQADVREVDPATDLAALLPGACPSR